MPHRHMFEAKGILATVTTLISGVVAWLPEVESLLRITALLLGIYASLHMARYWKYKLQMAMAKDRNEKSQ